MNPQTPVVPILSAPIAKQVAASFNLAGADKKQESVILNDVGVDPRLLAILNSTHLSPKITVTFSPDAPDRAPALKDYELPIVLRSNYEQHDLLAMVRILIETGSKVSVDKDTTRGSDGVLRQRITISNAIVEFVIGNGTIRGKIPISSNASISLPTGNITLW